MPDKWLTVAEAAELSGYHPDYLRRIIRAGDVKGQKFGPVWQVDRGSLRAYLKRAAELGEKRGPKVGT